MIHQHQERKRNCGQTCVAMILGTSQQHAEHMIGKKGGTQSIDLSMAIDKEWSRDSFHNFDASDPVRLYKEGRTYLPRLAILRMRIKGRSGFHWVVYRDKFIYDPELYSRCEYKGFKKHMDAIGWRITSYIRIGEHFLCGCLRVHSTPAADNRSRCWKCASFGP